MRLDHLLPRLDGPAVQGDATRQVHHVTRDSREVEDGSVFVAIRGARVDGHRFVPTLDRAAAVVVEDEVQAPAGVTVVRVRDSKQALARIAAALRGDPGRAVKVVGVTGTNGKTTVTTLVHEALLACGRPAGLVGTIGSTVDGTVRASSLTTPEAPALQALLAEARDAGEEAVAMEVSSIGLVQRRVDGIPFHLAVFTNLSQDHLDFHGDMEAYAGAKARLFQELLREPGGPPRALLCGDDPAWRRMRPPEDRWLYGFGGGNDLRIRSAELGPRGMALQLDTPRGPVRVDSALVGRHNALNLAAALGSLLALDVDLDEAAAGLGSVGGVPGRLEPVPNERGLLVLVDYAHTPDALEAAITAVREVAAGELWVVFGCGGDRDRGKRAAMGEVVARLADRPVVTSDNPRTEEPRRIVDDILSGMDRVVRVQLDRGEAIRWTLARARPGDAVLIAGKGHETTQEIEGVKHAFDDRRVAALALEAP